MEMERGWDQDSCVLRVAHFSLVLRQTDRQTDGRMDIPEIQKKKRMKTAMPHHGVVAVVVVVVHGVSGGTSIVPNLDGSGTLDRFRHFSLLPSRCEP